MKVTRFTAPVPVKARTGRMPSELTTTLATAIEDAKTTGNNQRYDVGPGEDAERIAVRIRQIASKMHMPLSVAITQMDGKEVVIFGPREGYTPTHDDPDTDEPESIEEITEQLRDILSRLERMQSR